MTGSAADDRGLKLSNGGAAGPAMLGSDWNTLSLTRSPPVVATVLHTWKGTSDGGIGLILCDSVWVLNLLNWVELVDITHIL